MNIKVFAQTCFYIAALTLTSACALANSAQKSSPNSYVTPEDRAVNRHLFQTQKRLELNRLKSKAHTIPAESYIPKQSGQYDPNAIDSSSIGVIQENYQPFSDNEIVHESTQTEINTIDSQIEEQIADDVHAAREAEAYRENYLKYLKDVADSQGYKMEIKENRYLKFRRKYQ